jgi:host factor-I protein
MPDTPSPTGQFDFLNALRKGRATVTLYLVNGIRLQGRIASFDRYSVLLQSRDGEVLIQNHAISTIGRDTGPPRRPRPDAQRDGERHGPRSGEGRPPRDPNAPPRPPRDGDPTRAPREADAAAGTDRIGWRRPASAPAPTVTIVRKGLRRPRLPGSDDPPSS